MSCILFIFFCKVYGVILHHLFEKNYTCAYTIMCVYVCVFAGASICVCVNSSRGRYHVSECISP